MRDTAGSPEQARWLHLARSGSQSQRRIWFILPTRGASHIINLLIIWQGKSERSDWFFLGRDFAIRTVSVETVINCVFFVLESRQIQNKHGPSAI